MLLTKLTEFRRGGFLANSRLHLLLFYILCNSYAFLLFLFFGETAGEFEGVRTDAIELTYIYALIVLGYIGIYYLYKVLDGVWTDCRRRNSAQETSVKSAFIDIFVFAVQIVLLYYVISEGAFTAGKPSPEGFVAIFSKLFVPDGIFLAYYAKYRSSKRFIPVAVVWAISMLLRGWGGTLFILAVAEYGWFLYQKKKNFKLLTVLVLGMALLSPYVYSLRQVIRGQEALVSGAGIVGLIALLSDDQIRESAASSGPGIFESISLRFQHLSAVYVINKHSDEIANQLEVGGINPFYVSVPFLRGFAHGGAVDITKYISKFVGSEGDWYIHTGMIGWLLVAPEMMPLFLLFIVGSVFILVLLLNFDRRTSHFTGYMGFAFCMLYLVFGWYSVYFAVVQGALLILLINMATSSARLIAK